GLIDGPSGKVTSARRRNRSLARDSTARFGLAPGDSTAPPRILAVWRQFTEIGVTPPCVADPSSLTASATYMWGCARARASRFPLCPDSPNVQPDTKLQTPEVHVAETHRAADRGGRLVHGEHGFDRDRDLAAGDRCRYRHEPAGAQARGHCLPAVARGL